MDCSPETYKCEDEGLPMAYREPPKSDHDAIMALWHAVIGTNGSGILEKVKRLEERPRAKWLVLKDVLVSGGVIAIVLSKILGG